MLVDSASFAPRLVIELDDRSHDRADRRERDAFIDDVLASAGIPILHVRWQRSYDAGVLAEQIAATLGIATPAPVAPPISVPTPAAFSAPIAAEASRAAAPMLIAPPIQPTPMRHICSQCQADLSDRAKFCPQCGAVYSVAQ